MTTFTCGTSSSLFPNIVNRRKREIYKVLGWKKGDCVWCCRDLDQGLLRNLESVLDTTFPSRENTKKEVSETRITVLCMVEDCGIYDSHCRVFCRRWVWPVGSATRTGWTRRCRIWCATTRGAPSPSTKPACTRCVLRRSVSACCWVLLPFWQLSWQENCQHCTRRRKAAGSSMCWTIDGVFVAVAARAPVLQTELQHGVWRVSLLQQGKLHTYDATSIEILRVSWIPFVDVFGGMKTPIFWTAHLTPRSVVLVHGVSTTATVNCDWTVMAGNEMAPTIADGRLCVQQQAQV